MRRLVALAWLSVVLVMLLCVTIPAVWLYTLNELPNPFDSQTDIVRLLRNDIESERRSAETPKKANERRDVTWVAPTEDSFPPLLRALSVVELGCPAYADTPAETGGPWRMRLLAFVRGQPPPPGDGACELELSLRLAQRLGATTSLQLAVAADRVHALVSKRQLVTLDLASHRHAPAVTGPEAAALELMQKPLDQLSPAEVVELFTAMPPYGFWDDLHGCANVLRLREGRDVLLRRARAAGHLSEAELQTALAQPMRCSSIKR